LKIPNFRLQIEIAQNPWKWKPSLGFAKNLRTRAWVFSLNDVSSERIYLLLPIFVIQVLRADIPFIGPMGGTPGSLSGLSKLFLGWLPDWLQKRSNPDHLFPCLEDPTDNGIGRLFRPHQKWHP